MAGKRRTSAPPRRAKPSAGKRRAPSQKRAAKARPGILRLLLTPFRWLFVLLWRLTLRGTVVGALILGLAVAYVVSTLPPLTTLLDGRARGSVTLLDRDGQVFAWRGEQFGGIITTDNVSPHLKHAVIATEDKRFYRHLGISPRGVASAVRINLSEGRGPLSGHGGSTITQQTAKLLCLGVAYDQTQWDSEAAYEADCRQTTMWRKVKEAVFALALEVKYTKDDVLTIYMNRAFLGAGARGFEAAAQRYFGKSASQVDPAEAAMLAGLLKAPTRYAPTNDLARSQERALTVLRLMEEQGYLSAAEAAQARTNPAALSAAAEARAGGYFADWVMEQGPGFLTTDTTEDVVIRTTFDPLIQTSAEQALQFVFDTKVREGSKAQAAIVVMSSDGAVRAMVGGRRFKGVAGQFNRAIMAKRQTGSSFKPFVYATALELGYGPLDTVVDEPITINVPGSGPWSPNNYDRKFHGRVTLTEALAQATISPPSGFRNSWGARMCAPWPRISASPADLALGPALALGASESTLIEMTGAYAGILNGGTSVDPTTA